MKQTMLVAWAAIGLSVTAAVADPVRMAQAIPGLLPASEIAAVARSAGFKPISPAMRRGDSYVLRATGPDGREVRLVVAARSGDIVSALPVVAAAPGGDRLGPQRMDGPPDYIPPPIVHEKDHPMRRPLAGVPGAPPPRSAAAPDYLPPSEPPSIMREERGEHGLLPPPPERFPPRAAAAPPAPKPVAKPAPVQRAAATPLPKPRPTADANAQANPAPPDAAVKPPPPEGKVDPRAVPH